MFPGKNFCSKKKTMGGKGLGVDDGKGGSAAKGGNGKPPADTTSEVEILRRKNAELHASMDRLQAQNHALVAQNMTFRALLDSKAKELAMMQVLAKGEPPSKKQARGAAGTVAGGRAPDLAALQIAMNHLCMQRVRYCALGPTALMRYRQLVVCMMVSKTWKSVVLGGLKMMSHVDFMFEGDKERKSADINDVCCAIRRIGSCLENVNLQDTEGVLDTCANAQKFVDAFAPREHSPGAGLWRPDLKILTLRDAGVEGVACGPIASLLPLMTRLEVLDIGSNQVGVHGTTLMLDALQSHTALVRLDLSNNDLHPRRLHRALTSLTSLTFLSLEGVFNHDGDMEGSKAVAKSLAKMTSLQVLSVACNFKCGNDFWDALCESLHHMPYMHALDLSDREMPPHQHAWTGQQSATFFEPIAKMHYLTELDLIFSRLGEESCRAMANALEAPGAGMPCLRKLNLSDNEIGDTACSQLARVLQHTTSLALLVLDKNDMGDSGVTALAPALVCLQHLEELHMADFKITGEGPGDRRDLGEDGARALAMQLQHVTSLKVLNLHGNHKLISLNNARSKKLTRDIQKLMPSVAFGGP